MNSEGIGTPIMDNVPCRLLAKPKNSAASIAPLGVHFPKIKHAKAMKPAPEVMF
ncbi:unannotated protein [freshwater metagenome]|uniref:Unannotated protein n=1 Tax=freshwater metagenome TaxID=449393 RepID=A0A6J6K8Q1_9ZZZZ